MLQNGKLDLIRGYKLALELGVSQRTIFNWVKKGILKKYGTCGCTFYSRSEVYEALIELKPNNFKTGNTNKKN